MSVELEIASDRLRGLLDDPALVQAGAWLSGYFKFQPDAPVSLPIPVAGVQDRCTDVRTPDWPYGTNGDASRRALARFAEAGLLQGSCETYRQTDQGKKALSLFSLYHLRNAENLAVRFPQLSAAVSGKRVLDAGCGLAAYTLLLHRMGARAVFALDYSEDHVNLSRWIARCLNGDGIHFLRGSVEGLPLPAAAVDLVFCRVVLSLVHHGRTVSEFARVLAPGGRALLMMHGPSFFWHHLWAGLRSRRFSNAFVGLAGLLGGLAFDLAGKEPLWKGRNRSFYMGYERRKPFQRLLDRNGLIMESWENGEPKPYVWVRKP